MSLDRDTHDACSQRKPKKAKEEEEEDNDKRRRRRRKNVALEAGRFVDGLTVRKKEETVANSNFSTKTTKEILY